MMKLLLADLDGTLRKTHSGKATPTTPSDQYLIPAARSALLRYKAAGWTIVGFSNQSAYSHSAQTVALEAKRTSKSRQQVVHEMRHFLRLAPMVDRIYFCPNGNPSEGDEVYVIKRPWWFPQGLRVVHEYNDKHPYYYGYKFRQPNPGMLELAIKDHTAEAIANGLETLHPYHPPIFEDAFERAPMLALMVSHCKNAVEAGQKCTGCSVMSHTDWYQANSLDKVEYPALGMLQAVT